MEIEKDLSPALADRLRVVMAELKRQGWEYQPGKTSRGRHNVKYSVCFKDKKGNGLNYLSTGHLIDSVEYDIKYGKGK